MTFRPHLMDGRPPAPDGAEASDGAGMHALPGEVMGIVFNFCDARTRLMTIPAVSKRWLGVCQTRRAKIDLTWAVRGDGCGITDVDPAVDMGGRWVSHG